MQLFKSMFSTPANLRNVDVTEANQLLNSSKPPFLVDVRTQQEFKQIRIQNATLLPLDELDQRMGELPKARVILVVCRSGARSSSAARVLANAGYEVVNMRGGMNDWESAGLPVRRG
jgi:rhodanese-related sulfurtransferase